MDEIIIGKRHRKRFDNIDSLARSIEAVGLLHPVVVDSNGKLIAGQRRIKAMKLLGRTEIPVIRVDLDRIVLGEFVENTEREDFTLSEAVAIKRAIEPKIKAAAKARMLAGKPLANLAQGPKGNTRDQVARYTGKKHTTLDKAAAVVDAAEAEPEKYGKLVEAMDKNGRVHGPYRRLLNARQAEAIRAEPPPLPNSGPYRVGVCDVPWPSEPDDPDPSERGYWPFPTMSIEELCRLDVSSIMHADSVLWFWTTNFHMRYAYSILDGWGFHSTPTFVTWAKDRAGRGQRLLGQTEHAIMAIRGKPVITLTNQTTLLCAPVRKPLGSKPSEFYDFVESLCPAPRYVSLFHRRTTRPNWDGHGDDVVSRPEFDAEAQP